MRRVCEIPHIYIRDCLRVTERLPRIMNIQVEKPLRKSNTYTYNTCTISYIHVLIRTRYPKVLYSSLIYYANL